MATKVEMVRDAIDVLGWAAKPAKYAEYIKGKYKVEMSKAHISQTKSAERKHRGVRAARKRIAEPATNGTASVSDILSFASTVREWQAKLGAEGVRTVVKTVVK